MCSLHTGSVSVNRESRQLFDAVGVDARGRFCLPIGNALPLEGATARAAGFNARPGDLTAVVVPSGTLVDILSLDDAGEVFCVLNRDIKLETAQKLAAEYAEDDDVAIVPAGKEAEAPTRPVDASSETDDADAIEGTEDAAETNVANDSEPADESEPLGVTVWLIRYTVEGEKVWWHESLTKKYAKAVCQNLKRRGLRPKAIRLELSPSDIRGLAGLPSSAADPRARFIQSAVRAQLSVMNKALPLVVDSGDIGLLAMSLREVAKYVDGIADNGSIDEVPDLWGFDNAMGPEGWTNDALKAALGLESEVGA